MPSTYKVAEVLGREEWEGQFGKMVTYRLRLEGREGEVDTNRKPDSPAPTVGEEIFGELTDGKYRPKLKKAQQQGGSTSTAGGKGSGDGFGWKTPPQDAERMSRSAALGHAVALAAIHGKDDSAAVLVVANNFTDFILNGKPAPEERF